MNTLETLRRVLKDLDLPENQAYMRAVYAALTEHEQEHEAAREVADAALVYRDCAFRDDNHFFRKLVAAVQKWEGRQ